MMDQINQQMMATPKAVQIWMNWMMAIFMASILFVWKRKAARLVFVCFILTMPIAMAIFHFTANVHLFGIAHLVAWLPLLIYLWKDEIKSAAFQAKSLYGIWLLLLVATIVISLVFDVRDIYLVMMGQKTI